MIQYSSSFDLYCLFYAYTVNVMRIQRCEGAHRSEGSHDLYWGRSGLSIWVGCNPAPLSLWPSPEISQFHSLMKYPPPLPRRGRVGWEKQLCINGVRVKIMSCCFKPVIASDISQRGCSVLVLEHGLLRMHERFMNMNGILVCRYKYYEVHAWPVPWILIPSILQQNTYLHQNHG